MTEPRHIAAAIAELGHATIWRAWVYLLSWHALARARVPALQARQALAVSPDSDTLEAAPLVETEAWRVVQGAGGGSRVLIGPVGVGKGYAATHWLLEHARRGRRCAWIVASAWRPGEDMDRDLARITQADCVVIDDVGRGSMSRWLLEQVNEAICGLHDRCAAVLVISNLAQVACKGDRGESITLPLLEQRTIDRMQGRIAKVGGASLRQVEVEQVDDREGRGADWKLARAIVEALGVSDAGSTPLDVGSAGLHAWDPSEVRFGGALARRLLDFVRDDKRVKSSTAVSEIHRVCRLLRLDAAHVRARAAEIEATSTDVEAQAAFDQARARIAAAVPPKPKRVEPEPWPLDKRRAHDAAVRAAKSLPEPPPVEWTRERLVGVGYRVVPVRGGYALKINGRQLETCEEAGPLWRHAAALQTPLPAAGSEDP